jgi:hypothetical protein
VNLIPRSIKEKLMEELQRSYLTTTLPPLVEMPMLWLEELLYGVKPDGIPIDRPIFIIGSHRSGTTVLYDSLAKHPDLAFFTNASALLPKVPILNHRLGELLGLDEVALERFLKDGVNVSSTTPSEGIRIWEYYTQNEADHCLDETYDNPEMERYLKQTIIKHLQYFHKSRFLNKNPDNSVRLRYLNKLFPDAFFIHIIRDARAVCASYLKVQDRVHEFFGPDHPHAQHGTKVKGWDELVKIWDEDKVSVVGQLWVQIIETINEDSKILPEDRFLEIRFEDFVLSPLDYFEKVLDFCQLNISPEITAVFEQEARKISLGNRNSTWEKYFSEDERERLVEIIRPIMQQYNYDI